jgi:hypothetical protein
MGVPVIGEMVVPFGPGETCVLPNIAFCAAAECRFAAFAVYPAAD